MRPAHSYSLLIVMALLGGACRHSDTTTEAIDPIRQARLREIERKQQAAAVDRLKTESDDRLLREVDDRLVTPKSYGAVDVVIPEQQLPVASGPMENLVDQLVSMRLVDADLQTIVMALSQIEGLNIIADSTLAETKTLTIDVKDVPLREILGYVARNMGIAFHVGANTIWVTQAEDSSGGPQLETRIFKIRAGDLLEGASALGGGGGGGAFGGFGAPAPSGGGDNESELFTALTELVAGGSTNTVLRLFPKRNLLLVRDTRDNIRLVEEILREFDHQPAQVIIEARFYSVGRQDALELGIEFDKLKLDLGSRNSMTASTLFSATMFPEEGLTSNISGIIGDLEYSMILHALAKKGNTRVLSAPRITVANNQTARIRRGETRYYFEEYDIATTGSGDNQRDRPVPVGTPATLEIGISLEATVNVGSDGSIMMNLRPEISDFMGWEFFDTAGTDTTGNNNNGNDNGNASTGGQMKLPRTREALVETTVIVQSGQTVVLGGMLVTQDQEVEQKVPLLGDIPLLGRLFRYKGRSNDPEHLIIFVNAKLVRPSGEFVHYEMVPVR